MSAHAALYHQEVIRRILMLREDLVRHDENLAAWHLMSRAVPYFVDDHPAIVEARDAQYAMTKHVLPEGELREEDRGRDPYEAYYATNPHERRFEQQYGIPVSDAHRLARVQYLLDWLDGSNDVREGTHQGAIDARRARRVLDLSANDGFMAARLSLAGYRCDCLDLHPGNCAIAHARKANHPLIGRVEQGALEDAEDIFCEFSAPRGHQTTRYDAVVMFETIEHVRDPLHAAWVAARLVAADGRLFVSTPDGAVEGGNLPNWDRIESKGHVRVFTADTLRALLEQVGTVEDLVLGPDRVLVARVKPA